MNNNERRCLVCKRLLIDEKTMFCTRCTRAGRNTGGKVIKNVGKFGMAGLTLFNILKNGNINSPDNKI
jgi:hypothetical protein